MENRTSVLSNSLIWFGAAVAIPEIITGSLIAPLGFEKGISAILIGHAVGCFLLFLAGYIGALTQKSAMQSVRISFGEKGAMLFSSLNILQLIGWTAVMIVSGAVSANLLFDLGGTKLWSLVLGFFIIIWLLIGIKNLKKVNIVAVLALFIFTLILSNTIFTSDGNFISKEGMSFGLAVELSAIMPLSWLPLISDYTRFAKDGKKATLASVGVYFVISSWMYIIGLGASLYVGQSDIAQIMKVANLGLVGLFIVLLSTITTTFMDAYSAGISFVSINEKVKDKHASITFALIGLLIAIFVPISAYEGFLYFIASVFAPMAAILLTDFYLLKKDSSSKNIDITNIIIWIIGFVIYRFFLEIETPVGNTLPTMIIISIICILTNKFLQKGKS